MMPMCYGWHYPTSEWLQAFYTPQVSLLLKIYFLVQNERHFVTQKKLQRMLNSTEKLTSIFAKFFQFKSSGRSYVFLVVFFISFLFNDILCFSLITAMRPDILDLDGPHHSIITSSPSRLSSPQSPFHIFFS